MYKLLIVEDEMLLRQGIVHMLNWTEHDFLIVGQVSNGKEALECIDTLKPDIIITDIIMPVMDGVEFTRRVKNAYPEIQIVVLSSYDDFSYVRETLRLGACDYVLKREINESMILEVLKRTAKKCIGGSEIVSPRQKTRLITSLFGDPSIQPEDARTLIQRAGLVLQEDNLIITVFLPRGVASMRQERSLLESAQGELEHFKSKLQNAVTLVTDDGYLILLCNEPDDKTVYNLAKKILVECRNHLNQSFMAFISNPFKGYEKLYSMLKKTLAFSQMSFYQPESDCFLCSRYNGDFPAVPAGYHIFNNAIEKLQIEEIKSKVQEVCKDIEEQRTCFDTVSIKNLLIDILNAIAFRLVENGLKMEEINVFRLPCIRQVTNAASFRQARKSMDHALDLYQELMRNRKHGNNHNVTAAKQYVEEHFGENISLAGVADALYLNKNYLSELFKKEVGINFTDYLTEVRIENAKKILREECLSVEEAGIRTGYPNTSYFIQLFKRQTGMRPTEYAKRFRKQS